MQGVLRKNRSGYEWMRVGSASRRLSIGVAILSWAALIYLTLWLYREIPDTRWHLAYLLALDLAAGLAYLNLGVWIHEQLHCVAFRGTIHEARTQIVFVRRYVLSLHGYYRVLGPIGFRVMRAALLGPLILVVGLCLAGWLGSLILPGWWLPILLALAVVSLADMIHDFF